MLSAEQIQFFSDNGYLLASQMFAPDEVAFYRDHFMAMRASGSYPGDEAGVDCKADDPLKRFPRLIHMHRHDQTSMDWMIEPRISSALSDLYGFEPYAVQTMLYFKPPGARGQALHQDQFYLAAQPGTCVAAWLALDDCDEENGCMRVVPGSDKWPLLCSEKADTSKSFTDVTVPIPDGTPVEPMIMKAGDVLFFNGTLVHGSYPNTSTSRFRRALIGHYLSGDCDSVREWYHPVYNMRGEVITFGTTPGGGPCGVWTEVDGMKTVQMVDSQVAAPAHE